jgi:hypothetical protein
MILFLTPKAWAINYQTFCEIEGNMAKGYVSVTSFEALTISGNVTFTFYDADSDRIATETNYEYEYIYHDTELVSEDRAPINARRCTFDVSQAVDNNDEDDDGNNSNVNYTAFCEIANGRGMGYVTVHSFDSLTIAGTVVMRFYDVDGDLVDTESGYEYEYIYHDTELVAEEDAPSDARWCTFDVSAAID